MATALVNGHVTSQQMSMFHEKLLATFRDISAAGHPEKNRCIEEAPHVTLVALNTHTKPQITFKAVG